MHRGLVYVRIYVRSTYESHVRIASCYVRRSTYVLARWLPIRRDRWRETTATATATARLIS
uniref:Uncharacterized protein n=1 Tax=Oryza brachyantha TaxID=4533 RepID=J3LD43_ORYBR